MEREHTVVIATGGNALIVDEEHRAIPDQYKAAATTCHHVADMIDLGWNVVVTHGNGPQVGVYPSSFGNSNRRGLKRTYTRSNISIIV